MNYFLYILLSSLLLFSCDSGSNTSDTRFDANCLRVPKNKKESYFPVKAFDDNSSYKGRTEFLSKWYSKHLFSMNEPVLYECKETSECYRFTWLKTFHEPIAVRITRIKDKIRLFWVKTNGAGGYNAGKIIEKGNKYISIDHLNAFKNKLDSCMFFKMNTNEKSSGFDGAQWILEGVNHGNEYHIVDRWKAKDTPFGRACLYLIELSGINIEKELIY